MYASNTLLTIPPQVPLTHSLSASYPLSGPMSHRYHERQGHRVNLYESEANNKARTYSGTCNIREYVPPTQHNLPVAQGINHQQMMTIQPALTVTQSVGQFLSPNLAPPMERADLASRLNVWRRMSYGTSMGAQYHAEGLCPAIRP